VGQLDSRRALCRFYQVYLAVHAGRGEVMRSLLRPARYGASIDAEIWLATPVGWRGQIIVLWDGKTRRLRAGSKRKVLGAGIPAIPGFRMKMAGGMVSRQVSVLRRRGSAGWIGFHSKDGPPVSDVMEDCKRKLLTT